MNTYQQLTDKNSVRRIEDGAIIPKDDSNRDWIEFKAFLKSGGVLLPPDPVIVDPRDQEKIIARQKLKDSAATDKEKLDALVTLNS